MIYIYIHEFACVYMRENVCVRLRIFICIFKSRRYVYACMCVCVYVCVRVFSGAYLNWIYIFVCICMHAIRMVADAPRAHALMHDLKMFACVNVYVYVCICVYMYMYVYIYKQICEYICLHVSICQTVRL